MAKNYCGTNNSCDCRHGVQGNKLKKEKIKSKKSLVISWQRLIFDGNTCPRCGETEGELNKAVAQLKEKLNPQGINVVLEKQESTLEEFKKNPRKSNQILLNGYLLEDLLSAKTGQSKCCGVCGDNECRTVEMDGESHETIPAALIVEAGIKAVYDNNLRK